MGTMYRIFGLIVESAVALPASLADSQTPLVPDVTIDLGWVPEALGDPQSDNGWYQSRRGEFLLRIDSVARYYVSDGRRITIYPEPGVEDQRILIFLMGSAFGALMHQRNMLALHAGAVAVNGGSVLFTGPSGIGKSTLTAAFHDRGHPFLADDVCAVTLTGGRPTVVPGFSRLKLWAEILGRLGKDKGCLQSIKWKEDQEKYLLPVEPVYEDAIPLKAVFVLESADVDEVEITDLKGWAKMCAIVHNTYRPNFLSVIGGRDEHFRQCASVASCASVYRVVRPCSAFLLDKLMDAVERKVPCS